MTDLPPLDPNSLKTRRQALRSQRRFKAWQAVWRFSLLTGMAGGMLWVMSWSDWTIRDQSQIQVQGNRLLSEDQVRQLLPLTSAQPIWQLPTQQLSRALEAKPPIAEAEIARQLFPVKLTVAVRERQPVARATAAGKRGFLDAEGVFIPQQAYRPEILKALKLPDLTVIGFESRYRPYWAELYPAIGRSPVKIQTVDWRNPSNVVLKTELGTVHGGPYDGQFPQKLAALAQLRRLPSRVPASRIIYIDLTDPDSPAVQLKPLPPQ